MSARLPRVDVLGTRVTAASFAAARDFLAERVARAEPAVLCCANVYSVMLGVDDPGHRERINRASFVMADGMPLVWTLRLRGVRAERVHGDDLMLAACRDHPEWRHFLLGGLAGQPEAVAAALGRRVPGITIAGTWATPERPVAPAESTRIVDEIRRAAAQVVWVGMGTPEQDAWMDAHAREVGVPLVGVGSAFDVLAGRRRAAPAWMKRSGLQWLFRLLQEPQRLGPRYLHYNPRFVWRLAREHLAGGR